MEKIDKIKLQCSVEDTDFLEINESFNGLSFQTTQGFPVVIEGANLMKIKQIVDEKVVEQVLKQEVKNQ